MLHFAQSQKGHATPPKINRAQDMSEAPAPPGNKLLIKAVSVLYLRICPFGRIIRHCTEESDVMRSAVRAALFAPCRRLRRRKAVERHARLLLLVSFLAEARKVHPFLRKNQKFAKKRKTPLTNRPFGDTIRQYKEEKRSAFTVRQCLYGQ